MKRCKSLVHAVFFTMVVCAFQVSNGWSQFDTIIDVPPNILDDGVTIQSNTQLNVFNAGVIANSFRIGSPAGNSTNIEANIFGGVVGNSLQANAGSSVHIFGGTIQLFFDANSGSVVNICDGRIGSVFTAQTGSTVNISGGRFGFAPFETAFFTIQNGSQCNISGGVFGDRFCVNPGANVSISGGDFRLNGKVLSTKDLFTLQPKDLFTAVLSDGSPFFASIEDGDQLINVDLIETKIPPVSDTEILIDEFGDEAPDGLRAGQTLTLRGDGRVRENFTAVDATLLVEGGTIGAQFGANLDLVNSNLTQTGGVIYSSSAAFGDSELNLMAGTLRTFLAGNGTTVNFNGTTLIGGLDAACGSTINVIAGTGDGIDALSGSEINVSGGVFGYDFEAGSSGQICGGRIRVGFTAAAGSDVVLKGGEFLVNNIPPKNPQKVSLGPDDVLTGTLEDGGVVVFSEGILDEIGSIRLESTSVPKAKQEEFVLDEIDDVSPISLRKGQSLVVKDQGVLADEFSAVDSTINIMGGEVGANFEAAFCDVAISGGQGQLLAAHRGTDMNISGGDFFSVIGGSGSEIDVCGGCFFLAVIRNNAKLDISGGVFDSSINLEPGGSLDVSGPEFFIDGEPIKDLQPGIPTLIKQRNVNLSGVLRDGSEFSHELNPLPSTLFLEDYFDPQGHLTVTLQDLLVVGDLNDDGVVDLLDVAPFVEQVVSGEFLPSADINKDGVVDLLDVEPFIELLLP